MTCLNVTARRRNACPTGVLLRYILTQAVIPVYGLEKHQSKQECILVGCAPTAAVTATRCQYQEGNHSLPWRQTTPPPNPVNRITHRHLWKHYLPLWSVISAIPSLQLIAFLVRTHGCAKLFKLGCGRSLKGAQIVLKYLRLVLKGDSLSSSWYYWPYIKILRNMYMIHEYFL